MFPLHFSIRFPGLVDISIIICLLCGGISIPLAAVVGNEARLTCFVVLKDLIRAAGTGYNCLDLLGDLTSELSHFWAEF